jgi:hypothetical protein
LLISTLWVELRTRSLAKLLNNSKGPSCCEAC